MKIGWVVLGGLHPSGREQIVPSWLALVERLARHHEVHAFVLHHLDRPQSYELRRAHVHDLGSPARGARVAMWAQWRALADALARHGPFDVLHGFWAAPAGVLAAAAGRRLRVPAIVTFDSGELVGLGDVGYGLQRTWRGRAAVRVASRLASRVHVCSGYMEALARAHGIGVVRIPLGIDAASFDGAPRPAEGPPWRLLQVASLNRVKDHRTLLDAVAIVARDADVYLDLAGEDTLDGEVQRHAKRLGLTRRVTFHGFVPHDELPSLHARAHLYVQSSRHEAACVAVLEAAASGLPVVGTDVGYVADWKPLAATAVALGDAAALASAILGLLRDPARREAQSTAAHRFARTYDADRTAASIEQLCDELRRQ